MNTEDKRQLVLDIIQELRSKEDGTWSTCEDITLAYRRRTGDAASMATIRNHIKALEKEGCVKSFRLGREVLFAIVGWEEPK